MIHFKLNNLHNIVYFKSFKDNYYRYKHLIMIFFFYLNVTSEILHGYNKKKYFRINYFKNAQINILY